MDQLLTKTTSTQDFDSPDSQTNSRSIHFEGNDQRELMDIEEHNGVEYSHHSFGDTLSDISENRIQEPTPNFSVELPSEINSFEAFVEVVEPLIQRLDSYIQNIQSPQLSCANDNEEAQLDTKFKFNQCGAKHFAGALIQKILRFYQDNRNLLFVFEEFNSEFKQSLSSTEFLMPFFTHSDKENHTTLDLLSLEFILTYQQEFDPFSDLEEDHFLPGLEQLIHEYEAILSEIEGENRLSYFQGLESKTDMQQFRMKETPASLMTQKKDLNLRAKAQILLDKVRSEIADPFSQQNYIEPGKSLSSSVMGGDLLLSPAYILNCSDEIKLREFLISEYHSPTDGALENFLSCFVEEKSKKLSISLYTAILLSTVFTNYSREVGETDVKTLEEIIRISKIIPFPTTTGLQILNYRYVMAKALDTILRAETEYCKPLSALNPQTQDFDLDIRARNQNSLSLCARFIELYESEAIQIQTHVSKKLSLYFDQFIELENMLELLNSDLNQSLKENFSLSKSKEYSSFSEQIENFFKRVENVSELDKFEEYIQLSCIRNKLLTGRLDVENNSTEKGWCSPKFGKAADSDDKMNNTSCQKEFDTGVKNSGNIRGVQMPENEVNQVRPSVNKQINYDHTVNNSDYVNPEWSLHEDSSHIADFPHAQEDEERADQDKSSNTNLNRMMEIENLLNNKEKGGVSTDRLLRENFQQNHHQLEEQEDEKYQKLSPKILPTIEDFGSNQDQNHGVDITSFHIEGDDIAKIEAAFLKILNAIRKRPTLIEIKNKLKESSSPISSLNSKKTHLEAQMKKAKDWLRVYKQVLAEKKGMHQIQELVSQISTSDIYISEMEELIQKQKQFMTWKIKFEAVITKIKNGDTDLPSDQRKVLTEQELEEVINTASELNIAEDYDPSSFQVLQETWNEIESFKMKVNSSGNDLSLLRKLYKGLKISTISLPELEEYLKEMINLNEEVIIYLENPVTAEKLSVFMEKIESNISRLDRTLYSQIQHKHDEAQRLEQVFQELRLPMKTYKYDVIKEIKSMLSSLRSFKIELSGQDLLKDVIDSFCWLLEFVQLIRKEQEGTLGVNNPSDSCNESFDLLQEKFDPEEVIKFCGAWLVKIFDPQSASNALKGDLKRLVQAGETIRIADRRIELLFRKLVWQFEIHSFSSVEKITNDFNRFIDAPEEIGENIDAKVTAEIQEESERIKSWNALYEEVISDDTEDFLRNKAESILEYPMLNSSIKNLKWKLDRLRVEYEIDLDKYPDFSEKIIPVRKFLGWIDWLIEAKDCIDDLETPNSNRLKHLEKLSSEASELEIPKSWVSYNRVIELFNLADAALAEYKQKFLYVNSYEKWTQSKGTQKESIHKFMEKCRAKPSITEAKALIDLFAEKLYYIDCQEAIADLDRKIEKYMEWKAKLEFFAANDGQRILPAALSANADLEDTDSIESQLNQSYAEYSCLDLRDEQDENFLLGLECQLRAYKLIKGLCENPSIEEWKKLLKYAEENSHMDPTEDKDLTNLIRSKIESAKVQKERLKELRVYTSKGQTSNISLEDVREIHDAFTKDLIKDEEEEKFIMELLQKVDRIIARAKQLCSSTKKEPIIEFTNILDQIKHLPIILTQEEKELEGVISSANQIAVFIRKNTVMNLQNVEKTLKEYSACPILIPEAQKLRDKYDSSRQIYDTLKSALNEILTQGKPVDFDQLKRLSEQVDDIHYDYEDNLILLKTKFYALRVEFLQKLAESLDSEGSIKNKQAKESDQIFKITPESVESLARQGLEIKEKLQSQQNKTSVSLNCAVFWIENLTNRLRTKIKEIDSVSNMEVLEKMPQFMLGFIDLSKHFADRKALLLKEISKQNAQTVPKKALEQKQKPGPSISDIFDNNLQKTFLKQEQIKGPPVDKKTSSLSGKDVTLENNDTKTNKFNTRALESKILTKLSSQSSLEQSETSKAKEGNTPRLKNNLETKSLSSVASDQIKQIQKTQSETNSVSTINNTNASSKNDQVKNKNISAVMVIRDILQSCDYLSLDLVESVNVANQIVKSFPLIQEDKEQLNKFSLLFRNVLNYPKIAAFLHKNSFPARSISNFLCKSPAELIKIENSLEISLKDSRENVNRSTNYSVEETQKDLTAKKKIKNEANSSVTNITENSVTLVSQSQKVKNPKETCYAANFTGFETSSQQSNKLTSLQSHPRKVIEDGVPSQLKANDKFFININQNSTSMSSASSLKKPAPAFANQDMLIGSQIQSEEEESLFDENEDDVMNYDSRNTNTAEANSFGQDSENTVLKIFEGKLQIVEGHSAPHMGFFTCDSLDAVRMFPKILVENNNTLRIQGKISYSRFEPYFIRLLDTCYDNNEYVISGWVESFNPACQEVCEKIAVNLLTQDKIGYYKYYECAKIFFLHENFFRPEWMRRLNFKTKYNSHPALYFILTFQPDKFPFDRSILQNIEPELIISNQGKKVKTNMRNTVETTPKRNCEKSQSQQQQERQITVTPQSQRCPKQVNNRDLEYSLLQSSLQLQENYSLQEKRSLDFRANMQIGHEKGMQTKTLEPQIANSKNYFKILEPITSEEHGQGKQLKQKTIPINSQRFSQCDNQFSIQSKFTNRRNGQKDLHQEEGSDDVRFNQQSQIRKNREQEIYEQDNQPLYSGRNECQSNRAYMTYEPAEEEDNDEQTMQRQIRLQQLSNYASRSGLQEQHRSNQELATQTKSQKNNKFIKDSKIMNQAGVLKTQQVFTSPVKGSCPQTASPGKPMYTPNRTAGLLSVAIPSQNNCPNQGFEDEEIEEDQRMQYYQNQSSKKQINFCNSQTARNKNQSNTLKKAANPPSFGERSKYVDNHHQSNETIQICHCCHSPWPNQPVQQVTQKSSRYPLNDYSNYPSQNQCTQHSKTTYKTTKYQSECRKSSNISPSKQTKEQAIDENYYGRQNSKSAYKGNNPSLYHLDPSPTSHVSPLKVNKSSQYEMEVEYNNFEQIQKPKSYDPSENPLYQSYLNKKVYEKSQPEPQSHIKCTHQKASKMNGNVNISSQKINRVHQLQPLEYSDFGGKSHFMVEYDEIDNRYARRYSSTLKNGQHQRGYTQNSQIRYP